jgi:hypothetical protein
VTASHLPRGEPEHALNNMVHFYGGGGMSEHVAIVAGAVVSSAVRRRRIWRSPGSHVRYGNNLWAASQQYLAAVVAYASGAVIPKVPRGPRRRRRLYGQHDVRHPRVDPPRPRLRLAGAPVKASSRSSSACRLKPWRSCGPRTPGRCSTRSTSATISPRPSSRAVQGRRGAHRARRQPWRTRGGNPCDGIGLQRAPR